jgi:hypothetical protein
MPNYQNCPPLNLPCSNRDYTFARNNNGGSATGHDSARFLKILSQASAFLLWPMAGALRMVWSLSRQRQVDPRSPQSFVAGHPTSNNRDPFTYINHVQNWPPVVSLPSWPVCPAELQVLECASGTRPTSCPPQARRLPYRKTFRPRCSHRCMALWKPDHPLCR